MSKINLTLPIYTIKTSDQVLFNYALYELDIKWQKHGELDDAFYEGECGVNGLQVTTLSHNQVCRFNCQNRTEIMDSVYVWHPLSKSQADYKIAAAEEFNLKFLSENWTEHSKCDDLVGEQWLWCISDGRLPFGRSHTDAEVSVYRHNMN